MSQTDRATIRASPQVRGNKTLRTLPFVTRHAARCLPALLFLMALALYTRTLAPSVTDVFSDTLEFQLVGPTLGIAHETGYPLYTLLSWVFSRLLPLGDAAYRVNLLSAVCASLAVVTVYLAAKLLTDRPVAAACAAIAFAVSPVWWSQAVIAEVYTLHGFFVALILLLALRWETTLQATAASNEGAFRANQTLLVLCLTFGLSLTHHRLTLLLVPAVGAFVLWTEPTLVKQPRRWPRLLAVLLLPLILYAYLPLRALVTTSLDGRYENTWRGFWQWVMASQYGAFLTGNPFHLHRPAAFYLDLFRAQFGWTGLILGGFGLVALLRRPRRWILIVLGAAISIVFATLYRTADVEVFFTPVFLTWSLLLAAGMGALLDLLSVLTSRAPDSSARLALAASTAMLAAACLLEPLLMAQANWPQLDRSSDWEVYDYGLDMLQQAKPDATVVALLGETTLLRYFQETEGMRTDVKAHAADDEGERLAAVADALAEDGPVYITRPLAGAAEHYTLSAEGLLVRVWPKGQAQLTPAQHAVNVAFSEDVKLEGYDTKTVQTHSGPLVRLTLQWRVAGPVHDALKVSARLLSTTGAVIIAADDVPVHNSYPTWAWLPGETFADSYDLPLPATAEEELFRILVILYRATDGSEVGRADLGEVRIS